MAVRLSGLERGTDVFTLLFGRRPPTILAGQLIDTPPERMYMRRDESGKPGVGGPPFGRLHERSGTAMIFGKLWRSLSAQLNKVANYFWKADPIAQMQYEYDLAVEQLKEGRQGLEQYRALVERVSRQVKDGEAQVAKLTAQAKAYLKAGDRTTAGNIALQLTKAKTQLAE